LHNARLFQSVQRQADEIAALHRASDGLLNANSGVAALAQHVAVAIGREFGAVKCVLLLLDRQQGKLLPIGLSHALTKPIEGEFWLDGRGLVAAAARTAQMIYAPDVRADARYLEDDPNMRSELAAPLIASGQVIGVLNLESPRLEAFDRAARRLFAAYAKRVALALENAQLLESLEMARVAAEEANQLKSQFLANTSHELRTPLTGIIGSLGLLREDLCETPEEQHQFINMAWTAARQLLGIVNDVLDFAKIEAGHLDILPQAVEVAEVLTEVAGLARVQADEKRLALEVCPPEAGSPMAWADPARLRQILLNLLGNAIKFTPAGHVVMKAHVDAARSEMVIAVTDTGIGVPRDRQARLFQPFVQADGSMTRQFGGTGLGLSISRRLAEQMGGSLTLFSEGENAGTTLTLRLPLAAAASPAQPA
jgi:signal transduction histidine kinase